MIVLDSNEVRVKYNNNTVKITIENYKKYKNFWKSTIENITEPQVNKGKIDTTITIKAGKCHTLKELLNIKNNNLSYRHSEYLFTMIGEQLKNLEKDNYSLFEVDLNDIILFVYGEGWAKISLLFLNTSKFQKLDENRNITINRPFLKNNIFLSPEVKSINEIPAKFNKNSWIYSIGYMISYCINNEVKKVNTKEEIAEKLKEFETTKLYYAVLRCLEIDPHKRFYLYI